jgi:hypothetical protein
MRRQRVLKAVLVLVGLIFFGWRLPRGGVFMAAE